MQSPIYNHGRFNSTLNTTPASRMVCMVRLGQRSYCKAFAHLAQAQAYARAAAAASGKPCNLAVLTGPQGGK